MKRLVILALTAALLGGCVVTPVGYGYRDHDDGYRHHDGYYHDYYRGENYRRDLHDH